VHRADGVLERALAGKPICRLVCATRRNANAAAASRRSKSVLADGRQASSTVVFLEMMYLTFGRHIARPIESLTKCSDGFRRDAVMLIFSQGICDARYAGI
jgi:hypothetical protein